PAGRLGLRDRELRARVADAPLDLLRAERALVVARPLTPFLRAVRVADRHADDRDRRVRPAERHDARNPPAGPDDHAPADLLAEDAVGRADVVRALGRHRRGLQSEPVLANRGGRFVDDGVLRRPAVREREIEALQLEVDPRDVRCDDAERLLEQLLTGLVALEHHDRPGVHRCLSYWRDSRSPCGGMPWPWPAEGAGDAWDRPAGFATATRADAGSTTRRRSSR